MHTWQREPKNDATETTRITFVIFSRPLPDGAEML
jgi:hypothetical protein